VADGGDAARGRCGLSLRSCRQKLSFDRGLVDDGPDLRNLLAPKFIEHILAKRDTPPVDIEAKELPFWRAVEDEPARDRGGSDISS